MVPCACVQDVLSNGELGFGLVADFVPHRE